MPQSPDPQKVGSRIEELLAELLSDAGARVGARAEELVRLLVELYGAALERVVTIVCEDGGAGPALLDRLAGDDLVASLLILHDLHPVPAEERVRSVLSRVEAGLGSSLELLEIDDEGVAHVRAGSGCDGAPLSASTRDAVQGAVQDAAPEVRAVEVVGPPEEAPVAFIPLGSLRRKPVPPSTDPEGDGARSAEARS
ncbi:MAG TPA: hypothetical protein VG476_07425 [Acidimicrobiales bacterium]|nr:hypothetical protein [Acidimicrobiales bacterium]